MLGANAPYPTLARVPLVVAAVTATLQAPAQVAAGAAFAVCWTELNNDGDYIGIGNATQKHVTYNYTRRGSPLTLAAHDAPCEWELRYILAQGDTVVADQRIVVGGSGATVAGPAEVAAGASFTVTWRGPSNDRDFVALGEAGAAEQAYESYAYTSAGSKLTPRAPDQPGDYELRYLTGQTAAMLARAKLEVAPVKASVAGPAQATADDGINLRWPGPANANDFLTILLKGALETASGEYAYASNGSPLRVALPLTPGAYEIRYSLGQSYSMLARAPLKVVPGAQAPGKLVVAAVGAQSDRAVHVILDASGSILQELGGQCRIDIARQKVSKFATATLPAGTPFVLREFGRTPNSCDTDVVMRLAPLDLAAAAKTIAALEAQTGARTAIGAALEQVAADLRAVRGERIAIVITDGGEGGRSETCRWRRRERAAGLVHAAHGGRRATGAGDRREAP